MDHTAHRPGTQLLRRLLVTIVALAALVVAVPVTSAAAAPGPSLQGAANLRDCVNTGLLGCQPTGQLPARAPVTMICWIDGSTATGKYTSQRWFFVAGGGRTGFVHSSWVIDQWRQSPPCGADRGVSAVRWAAEHVGQTRPSGAEAAGLGVNDGMWSGWCAAFTYGSYLFGSGSTPRIAGNAAPRFYAYQRAGLVTGWTDAANVPVGAMLFWPTVAAPYGHTAIYAGNGYALSTQGLNDPSRPIARVPVGTWGTPAGWVAPDKV
ncbi:hypothetical protein [Pseudonocardia oroxyli]|uniref:CHAP domain-containing protein n=1 Tax=Pseudonocardia oroxyli TaxID=366584 RepID=A0A1G8CSX5_PSEOR|nr:hypothetical protein [Pseudonocardia oroxyli]SDH48541.1 hypothetical protein SAMN05216377_12346 [Pseudonocardia oroxyli]